MLQRQVALSHFASRNPVAGRCVRHQDGRVQIASSGKISHLGLTFGDPVVVGFEEEREMAVWGGIVESVNQENGQVTLLLDLADADAAMRTFERVPVSLFGEVRVTMPDGHSQRYSVTIKDISKTGLLVHTGEALELQSVVELTVFHNTRVHQFRPRVARQYDIHGVSCYGMRIGLDDIKGMAALVTILRQVQEDYISRFPYIVAEEEMHSGVIRFPAFRNVQSEKDRLNEFAKNLDEILRRRKY